MFEIDPDPRDPIHRALVVETGPTEEPITLAEVKGHLRVIGTTHDALLTSLITAAREEAESYTRRRLITQTWDLWLERFPKFDIPIAVPRPPLQSVTSIFYTNDLGNLVEWDSANYVVDTDSEPGRVYEAHNQHYPDTRAGDRKTVRVRHVAGYGAAAVVPERLKHAMKLLVEIAFDNPPGAEKLQKAAERAMFQYRVQSFE